MVVFLSCVLVATVAQAIAPVTAEALTSPDQPNVKPNAGTDVDEFSSIPDPDWVQPQPTGILDFEPDFDDEPWVAPYEDFVALRSQYDLDSSRSLYDELKSSDPMRWIAGVPLSMKERSIIDDFAKVSDSDNDIIAAAREVPGFAGAALAAGGEPGTVTLYGTKDFVNSVSTEAPVVVVSRSLAELEEQRAELLTARDPSGSSVLISVAIDVVGNELDVSIAPLGESRAVIDFTTLPVVDRTRLERAAKAWLDTSYGAVGDVEVGAVPENNSLCSIERCLPTSSGVGIGHPSQSNTCTSAFTLRRWDTGNLYQSTAAHCYGLGWPATSGDYLPQVALGPVAYHYHPDGGNGDLAAIDVPDTIATNDLRLSWSSVGAGYPATAVEHQWMLATNEQYCVAGLVTSGCGGVTSNSTSGCFAVFLGICTFWLHDLIQGTWTGTYGDSGAGAYLQYNFHNAVGILKGSGYYTTLDNINSLHPNMQVHLASDAPRDWTIPIYVHGLQRNPDAGGLAYWEGYLGASCGLGRARDVYYNIMLSAEMVNSINYWDYTSVVVGVHRLYRAGLGRHASGTETQNWWNHVNAGTSTAARQQRFADIVYTVTFSGEFSSRVAWGSQGDRPACSQ